MTIREFLTNILKRNREIEEQAKNDGDYGKCLKKQGAIEISELIFMELNKSHLFDKEIKE
jgi:hypothetical protein